MGQLVFDGSQLVGQANVPSQAVRETRQGLDRQAGVVVLDGLECWCLADELGDFVKRVALLRERYRAALQVGGSGVDLKLRLAPEIEAEPPDFSLYPELGERAIGFITRGCPKHCSFCIVPRKEGAPGQVSDLEGVLQRRRHYDLFGFSGRDHVEVICLYTFWPMRQGQTARSIRAIDFLDGDGRFFD